MLPLTGYADRLSAKPGGRIAFKVSSTFEEPYQMDVVRIRHADPNPAGPGMKLIAVPMASGSFPSRVQPVHLGSYVQVGDAACLHGLGGLTLGATVWPTVPSKGPQAVISKLDAAAGTGFALEIGPRGAVLRVGLGGGRTAEAAVGKPMRGRTWDRIDARLDAAGRTLTVRQQPIAPQVMFDDEGAGSATAASAAALDNGQPLLVAAEPGARVTRHMNGKIERPFVSSRALSDDELAAAAAGTMPAGTVAAWDFSRGMSGQHVADAGPNGLDGTLVNLPGRAMKGSNWSGEEMCWRHAPGEYGAIHFHEDDIYDCGWDTDFTIDIPAGTRSGVYGARIRCRDAEDIIPFYVRPPTGTKTADVAYLASTFTYQVYANHRRGVLDHPFRTRMRQWGAYPHNPDDVPDYAHSTYNYHTDGSGVSLSSRFRPILTMRPGYLTFYDPFGSGLRHFPADSHLTDWMEEKGHDFDVITDEDLDEEGIALLRPYKVLITGSHPEYHTKATLDALSAFTEEGGRLMYMGGNGFYWRVARHPDLPGMIEIRRAEGGIRAWAAEPGEYFNALDGAYGGLWRRNDRPPQKLAGVGFSSQGFFEGSYYRRKPGADDPRASWIFKGVDDEVIGNFGLSGGGAAGFELDRADVRLGTPEHAIVLASSENHTESFIPVLEDQLSQRWTATGEPHAKLIRADMVYFETPNGGAVFSVGSITFCGSLSHNNYDNNVSRIVDNVLNGFKA